MPHSQEHTTGTRTPPTGARYTPKLGGTSDPVIRNNPAGAPVEAGISGAHVQYGRLQRNLRGLYHSMLAEQEKHNLQLKRAYDSFRNERARMSTDLEQQQKKIDAYEADLQHAQLAAFAEMARTEFSVEEDRAIMDDVSLLHDRIWAWAASSCLPETSHVREAINKSPSAIVDRLTKAGVDLSLLDTSKPTTLKRLPALILAALVAEDIYSAMFCRPFFFVDGLDTGDAVAKAEALNDTMIILSKYNRNEAVNWRAQLLRTVRPPPCASSIKSATPSQQSQATEDCLVSACNSLAQAFLAGPGVCLLGDCVPSSTSQLMQCYVQAGKLFTRLFAQPLDLQRWHKRLLGVAYDPHFMQPHPVHGSLYDKDNDWLEGKRVTLVVSPLVQKVTQRDGTTQGVELAKAVVCLDV